jgi:hypothetical protein
MKNKRGLSIFQILLLFFSIISFSYVIGSEIKFVGALNLPKETSSSSPNPIGVTSSTKISDLKNAYYTAKKNYDIFIQRENFDPSKLKGEDLINFNNAKNELTKAEGALKDFGTGSKSGDWLLEKGWFDTSGPANFFGHIADGLFWSMTIAAIKFIGGFVDDEGIITDALSSASFGGK